MTTLFILLALVLSITTFLPSFNFKHWTFRVFDFIRIQLLVVQLVTLLFGLIFLDFSNFWFTSTFILLSISIYFQIHIISPYIRLKKNEVDERANAKHMHILSSNVLQKNQQYSNLISLIHANKPDIVFTMETNGDWERALEGIESDYKYAYKIPLENRYGMHFYTNLNVVDLKEHYLIAKDRPAIEVHLKDSNGTDFIFWGIHPPPPSPTEKETSKQKDAELMVVAKLIQKSSYPCIITGDFNNVSWSKSAKLFAKISGCKDARIGKGVHATFPVKPKIFRFPIDLLFNSKAIKIHSIQTLSPIGSDHLPITTSFSIAPSQQKTEKLVKRETEEKAAKIITEGHQAVQEEE